MKPDEDERARDRAAPPRVPTTARETAHDDVEDLGSIEVRVRELSQLFNSLDPSPFRERELDDDAAAYIESWARELPKQTRIRIVIHLPEAEARRAEERGLEAAITNHFEEKASAVERERRELSRLGTGYLAIGIFVLLVCLGASQIAGANLGSGPVARAIEEGLVILGWVANWRPIETFLYDGWPLRRRRALYRRLAAASVEIMAR